ncbi:hypothetical protein FHG64_02145 [Antarcticibacterium flavum]|uniref:GH26 domain-containing protein n=1 Tax=Antarcticibacterium flavum TaxID=2058175 RepID=A0A5B7X0Z6_9FLAO|nr:MULTISPECIES: hypothetical protein [Antarcticibacterium]MCM4161207.1 hypothetical protein [Antarcticibacterium sp. W02-3]QCY68291.1 hypothetical protein FHG64_02145 [Antarcticibacterium flavum]
MMKKILATIMVLAATLFGYYIIKTYPHRINILFMKSKMEERFQEAVLGVYDREEKIDIRKVKKITHYTIRLNDDDNWRIDSNHIQNLHDTIPVMLTVEMWDPRGLTKTSEGRNNKNVKQFFSLVITNRKNIYIRWNPEMEVPVNLYPWNNRPLPYIAAFREFAQILKEINPEVKMVYSPAGFAGALENYPGDDVVDFASITLNSKAENHLKTKEHKDLGSQITRKLHRLRFINKPILIITSDNAGDSSHHDELIKVAIKKIQENRDIIYSTENFKRPSSQWEGDLDNLKIGLYDPQGELVHENAVNTEHLFISFKQIESGSYIRDMEEVIARNHDLIISVEPAWWNEEKDKNILNRIKNGELDKYIEKFYQSIPATNRNIYLRFAHEMEIPITRYPWQSADPLLYIEAFRYFMQYDHGKDLNIYKIWGPAGDRGSLDWWPGNDVVDFISIAIYGLPDKNISDPNKQESFSKILNRKMFRFRLIDKPIFITEFGVKGEEEFQTHWLREAAYIIKQHPRIRGISYFNYTDSPEVWGDISPPQWTISKNSFSEFIRILNTPLK